MIMLQDELRLRLAQRIRLSYHLFICRACKFFFRQHKFLNKHWKHAKEADVQLTDEEKKNMANRMNNV